MPNHSTPQKIALITGAAKRVGAEIARALHIKNINVAIHYHGSQSEAVQLYAELNQLRPNSAICLQANLIETNTLADLIERTIKKWGQLDILINNASSFYPTPFEKATPDNWEDLMSTNLKAPFFLAQAATPYLKKTQGCIINMVDIRGQFPLKNYSIYCIAKAGLRMLTQALARDLAPLIRVNAIAPGVVLWPDEDIEITESIRKSIIKRTPLEHVGTPLDISKAVLFLIQDANHITGQVITIDGGQSLVV